MEHGTPDTISAVATASGPAGVAVVRLSGAGALAAAARLAPRRHFPDRQLVLAHLVDPRTGRHLDTGFVCAMRAPRSFTGEDVVELHVHGGSRNLSRVLAATLAAGARLAAPGEFTRRAVLHGRLDLTQAEALLDIVEARSDAALDLAHRQYGGALTTAIAALAGALDDILVRVEADLDFPDEEGTGLAPASLAPDVAEVAAAAAQLAGTFDAGRTVRDGFRVVLLGAPNAGKSTLFNALLGEERAIVAERPGTTRDFLEERTTLEGLPFVLVDTAGVRDAQSAAEREGVTRAWAQAESGDLVLALVDGSRPPGRHAHALLERLPPDRALVVLTKSDVTTRRPAALPAALAAGAVTLSARTGAGLDTLRAALVAAARPRASVASERTVVTRLRHRQALERAGEALLRAGEALTAALPLELVAADLHAARRALGEVVGDCPPDELLDRIFARFCIGK